MFKECKSRYGFCIRVIATATVLSFLVAGIVWANPDINPSSSTLAAPSQLTKKTLKERIILLGAALMHPAANEALSTQIKVDKETLGDDWERQRTDELDFNDPSIRGYINDKVKGLGKFKLIKVTNAFKKTGQFGHVGLSGTYKAGDAVYNYGMPVIFTDALYHDKADMAALRHEVDELIQWEVLRSLIAEADGIDRKQVNMREWIKAHMSESDAKLDGSKYSGLSALEISKKIHEASYPLEDLYRLVNIDNDEIFFQHVDYDYIRDLYDRYRDEEGKDVTIAAGGRIDKDPDRLVLIHETRDSDRATLKSNPIKLDGDYLLLAEELLVLAREVSAFTDLPSDFERGSILADLENAKGAQSSEGTNLAKLYRSAVSLVGNDRVSPMVRKKAPILLAIEYIRDNDGLYPQLSGQIKVLSQGDVNLIQALSNFSKDEVLSVDYKNMGTLCIFVQNLFTCAMDKPNERRLSQGRDEVLKVLKYAAQLGTSLTEADVKSARNYIFGSDVGSRMNKEFAAMRVSIQFYNQSLPVESVDRRMAVDADILIYDFWKGGTQCTGIDFQRLVERARQYIGARTQRADPEAAPAHTGDRGADTDDGCSFWDDFFDDVDMGGVWEEVQGRRRSRGGASRAEEDADRREREMARKLTEELGRVKGMIESQGFELFGSYDYVVGWGKISDLGVKFPAQNRHARWNENAIFNLTRSIYIIKSKDENEFVVDFYVARSPEGYLGSNFGTGYSVKISLKDTSNERWQRYPDSEREVFTLGFGDSFAYNKEKREFTLVGGGVRITMDTDLHLRMTCGESGDIESMRTYRHKKYYEETMSIELYNMLKQYAAVSQITIYGSREYPFQFALIDDPYNRRSLIVNHKGAVIFSSTEEGAIERMSLSYCGDEKLMPSSEDGRLRGVRKDGTKFILNRYGIEEGRKTSEGNILKGAWGQLHTACLLEVCNQLIADRYDFHKAIKDTDRDAITTKLISILQKKYSNLTKPDIGKIILRCFEIWQEMLGCDELLKNIFKEGERSFVKGKNYHYFIVTHGTYESWRGLHYGGQGIRTEGAVGYALETIHVRCDWDGSLDYSDFEVASFEFYITDTGQLKVKFNKGIKELKEFAQNHAPIDIALLEKFYDRYSPSAGELAATGSAGRSSSRGNRYLPLPNNSGKGSPADFLNTVRDNLLEQALSENGFAFKDIAPLRKCIAKKTREVAIYKPGTVYKEIQILISLGILERVKVGGKVRIRFTASIRSLDRKHAALAIGSINNIEYKIGDKNYPLQRYDIPDEQDRLFAKELAANVVGIVSARYLSDALSSVAGSNGRFYVVKYNQDKLEEYGRKLKMDEKSFTVLLDKYADILRLELGGKDRVELKPSSGTQPLVSVECYSSHAKTDRTLIGKGHVNMGGKEDEIDKDSIVQIIGMVNIAFAVSNIPLEAKEDDLASYSRIISFIQNKCRELTGSEISLEKILRGDRIITLPPIKAIPPGKLKQYYELTIKQLSRAA